MIETYANSEEYKVFKETGIPFDQGKRRLSVGGYVKIISNEEMEKFISDGEVDMILDKPSFQIGGRGPLGYEPVTVYTKHQIYTKVKWSEQK